MKELRTFILYKEDVRLTLNYRCCQDSFSCHFIYYPKDDYFKVLLKLALLCE